MRRLAASLILMLAAIAQPAMACRSAADDPCATPGGTYRAIMPEGVARPPAIVWLHGMGGSSASVMRNRGMVGGALARGYALIAPDGLVPPNRRNRQNWAVRDGRSYARDDIDFVAEVIADAARRLGIDPDRVLLAGFSRGGSMVWDIACHRPALARAFAPVAGAFWEPMTPACAGPVDLYHTHGWTDRIVPLEGRPLRNGTIIQGDVFQSLFVLRAANRCASRQPEQAPVADGLWRRSWTGCRSGRQIDLDLHSGGHSLPKGWLDRALDWFEARLARG